MCSTGNTEKVEQQTGPGGKGSRNRWAFRTVSREDANGFIGLDSSFKFKENMPTAGAGGLHDTPM